MSLQSIINSRIGVAVILVIGRIVPPSLGSKLADRAARWLASKKDSPMMRAVRANQWIITGEKLSADELDKQAQETLRKTTNMLYDFYHTLNDHQAILERVILSPKLTRYLDSRLGGPEGTLMIAPHLSNFDLAGRAMALNGYGIQALSYPQPGGGYKRQNRIRKDIGIDITPMSTESMRKAKKRLKNGGGVITGLERPLLDTNYYPKFFGYPAPVPVSYVRMALQTNSAVLVIACVGTPQENYRLECSDLIYMKPYKNRQAEIERNAERVLKAAEIFIGAYPTQWAMSYPVWPFALEEMPV
jgi:lauroyl/myristoyl acyltransferase